MRSEAGQEVCENEGVPTYMAECLRLMSLNNGYGSGRGNCQNMYEFGWNAAGLQSPRLTKRYKP